MKNKTILAIIMVAIMLAGCGKVDEEITAKAPEKKEETIVETEVEGIAEDVSGEEDEGTEKEIATEVVEKTTEETVPTEQVKSEDVQKTEKKKTEQKKTQSKTETPVVTTPVVSAPVTATPEPEVNKETCEHWYQAVDVEEYYPYIYEMKWGCNGCGYPLYDILGDGTAVNFSDMYSHPPCETDRYDEPCTGGGFHSELYYSGKCYQCHSEIIMRSCTYFYVMAERCMKNPGNFCEYEKVEDGCAYIKSCTCGKNLLVSGGQTGGLMVKKEICSHCGDVKTYPEK